MYPLIVYIHLITFTPKYYFWNIWQTSSKNMFVRFCPDYDKNYLIVMKSAK